METRKESFEFGKFRLDVGDCVLLFGNRAVPLEPLVFKTLHVLVANSGHLVRKERLLDEIWGEADVEEGNLVRNISLLRKALSEGSSGESYIETVPKRGYRFVAEVKHVVEDPSGVHVAAAQLESNQSRRPDHSKSRVRRISITHVIAIGLVAIAILAAAAVIYRRGGKRDQRRDGAVQTSIAVLPFKPFSGSERDEALEIGMAEALINQLSTVQQLSVRPLGVVRRYAGLDQDPLAAGRQMGVDAVLESSLHKSAEGIRVTARLLRVRDGAALWSFKSDEPQASLFSLQDLLSERVAASLVAKPSHEQLELMRGQGYTDNAEAYQLYLKGRFFFEKVTPDGVRKSIAYFQEAIDKDPDFALAYCGMCASYTLFGHLRILRPAEAFPAAKAALARALELDDSLSEAHSQAGFIALHYDYDWARADREFERAIELNPQSPMAHHGRAFYLAAAGRTDEAVEEINRALDLNPVSLHFNSDAGVILCYAGRNDEAISQLRKTLDMDAGFALAAVYLARAYAQKHMDREAFVEYQKSAGPLTGVAPDDAGAARAFAASGLAGYYHFEVDRLRKQSKFRYVPPLDFARLFSLLGERERALQWLGKAVEDRNFAIPFLKVDRDFENLWPDPRFAELTRKLGLR